MEPKQHQEIMDTEGMLQGLHKAKSKWELEEFEDVTLRGLDGVLIRCKDMAST